jgi:hypothetical protein
MIIANAGFGQANTTFSVCEFLDFRSKGLFVKSERTRKVDAGSDHHTHGKKPRKGLANLLLSRWECVLTCQCSRGCLVKGPRIALSLIH